MRVKFQKGKQRGFLDLAVKRLNCVSLRGILQFGLDVSYDCLKNYYNERRLMDKIFFEDLCHISKIDKEKLKVEYLKDNWGQIKGGKKSKR
ncbi:MAG: hypothetical protein PHH54_04460 [Candidatus Nanoarchaeia archaeon]|nr:hypothetical protein [Candidatus Nanoarchaeia archaeon]MDD5741212.1 hypothetical protein [Candidatus Nanoarchaeia archaeon]